MPTDDVFSVRLQISATCSLPEVSKLTGMRSALTGGVFQSLGAFVVRRPVVVIGCWIVLAAVLALIFPPLTQMARERPVDILPAGAPVTVTTQQMTEAFHESGSQNILLAVLTDDKGLGQADEAVYRTLVADLRQDTRNVVMVQDFVNTPPLRDILTSKDKKAWLLPIGLAGALGSPQAFDSFTHVAQVVRQATAGTTLNARLTGPAGTIADLTVVGERDVKMIELATVVMVLAILLLVYRNAVTMLLPLVTIGISLVTAQGFVSGLAQLGLGISGQTIAFMTALVAGAGTDYAVFLISRYHDYLRLGMDSDQAVVRALVSVGKVTAASAGTVVVTFLGMVFTRLGLFATIGPALAVSVAVAFVAAVTMLPAVLVLAGRRGWVAPRRDLSTRFWRRSGIRIVRRPKAHLVASLLILVILASCGTLANYNYDDRKNLPASTESNLGYAAIEQHFSLTSTIPQYLFITSPRDLRTPKALADLEQMAQRVSQLPGIELVRGVTRPTGESLEQARLSYQAGEVGNKLNDASQLITDHNGDLNLLTNGANTLADSLNQVRGQVGQAMAGVRGLVDALSQLQTQFGGDKTLEQIDTATRLASSMRAFGDAIGVNLANAGDAFEWAAPVVTALDGSLTCSLDPSCSDARGQLHKLVAARNDGSLDKIIELARQLQATQDTQTLDSTATTLRTALNTANNALRSSGLDDPNAVQSRLTTLQQGADTLADGSRRLADGVQVLVDQTRQLGTGLDTASGFLLGMKNNASGPSMSGFYIPEQFMNQDDIKKAASAFVSPDGHSVRYLVQTKLSPFSIAAMNQVNDITNTARGAQPNTELSDASISMGGFTATLRDMRDYYDHDIGLIIVMTVMVVLLILIALLRAIVAPLYLIGSVMLSYLSAVGIGVIVFQFILGQELSWSVPGLAFIVLVAVGADYNMLLISRLREESASGIRTGVIRTVGSTGGVITSAGVIFAASMFGLVFGSVATMVQAGFIMAAGLMLDTFLVRTILVPSVAVMIGRANWWPSRPHQSTEPANRHSAPAQDRGSQLSLF
ncbi:MAG: putative drug exporter of the superfamily [Mycobacterium sp.]|nr:putative drug exporter of the superfamily [Mycobacterium sp.]